MNFNLTKPCKDCPFLKEKSYLTNERASEISISLTQDKTFSCHKTNDSDEETGEGIETEKSEHCAGAMILLERINRPNQMMRMAERMGFYNYKKLDMTAHVFESFNDFIKAQKD